MLLEDFIITGETMNKGTAAELYFCLFPLVFCIYNIRFIQSGLLLAELNAGLLRIY